MIGFLTGNTPEKWEEIKTHPFYKDVLEKLLAHGEDYLATPVPALSYTAYCRFYKDGSRAAYEKPYHERRARMTELAILCRLYGEKYLDALCDVLWAIMEEDTWALAAHIKDGFEDPETRRTFLELGSTQTAKAIVECELLVGDLLPKVIRDKMKTCVRERIVAPFFKNMYWWYNGDNNWAAVCGACVMFCIAHYGTVDEFYRAEPTMNAAMLNFLASYGEDACCLEGISYWYYGFGHFVRYADTVRRYTKEHPKCSVAHIFMTTPDRPCKTVEGRSFVKDGVIDYFARDDVRRSALFGANMRLKGNCSVSFSDGSDTYYFEPFLLGYLKKEYPDEIVLPSMELARFDTAQICNYLWSDPAEEYGAELHTGTVYYGEGQWFIVNKEKYSFVAKGGNNHESHNHNDVANFLITTENGMSFADLGAGEYTRQYFDDAYRYDLLVCSSRGHSVPIINGAYQERPSYTATAETDGFDHFSVSYAPIYEQSSLTSAVRDFSCDENGITIVDSFTFAEMPSSLVERFVAKKEPILSLGEVRVGETVLRYDPSLFDAFYASEVFSDHTHKEQIAYLIDLVPKTLAKELSYSFRFDVCV